MQAAHLHSAEILDFSGNGVTAEAPLLFCLDALAVVKIGVTVIISLALEKVAGL